MRDLLAKPLLVVTGTGGVGKSTVAAAHEEPVVAPPPDEGAGPQVDVRA